MSNGLDSDAFHVDGFSLYGALAFALDGTRAAIADCARSDDHPEALDVRAGTVFQIYDVPRRRGPLADLTRHPDVLAAVGSLLDEEPVVAWALMLNKTQEAAANWSIPWHQDTSVYCTRIPAGSTGEVRGGFATFRPTDDTMSRLIVARIALDLDDPAAGCLEVIPASHSAGRLLPFPNEDFADAHGVQLSLTAGDLMMFRPLLVHRAGYCTRNQQRRIIHVYYRPASLVCPGSDWISW